MAKKKIELEFLRKAIGKEITITYPYHHYVDGKLIDVNEKNLTLIVEDEDGYTRVIPYKSKHIYYITIYGKIKVNHHVRSRNNNAPYHPNKEQKNKAPY